MDFQRCYRVRGSRSNGYPKSKKAPHIQQRRKESEMKELHITVTNETGLHARPADVFVRTAKLFDSDITVTKGEKSASAKAIIRLILLNVSQHDEITITANGPDEQQALDALQRLITSDFQDILDEVKVG
jgi:phosphotransferase system HPr (HPr) family protein